MNTQLRPSGIEEVRDMPWGTHFCMFYQTKDDLLDILIPYFKAGLESHEFCLYVASEPLIAEEAERALREAVPNFERYLAEGQIEIVSHSDWYLRGGHFDPLRVRQAWIDKLNRGLAQGNAGMRFAANTFWLEKEDWDSFAEYEGKVDEAFRKLRIVALCAYALERCSTADMLNVVRHHQFTVVKRNEVWEHLESSELKRAHDEIRQLNADLERRVLERTAELDTTNEQLKLEITARKAAEESLREAQARTESVLASVADTHILLDRQWRYIYVNEAAIRAIGRPREQILESTLWELYPDIVGTELDYQYHRAMDERRAVVFDYHYETLDTWWANRFYPTPEGLAIFGTEITERKRAEALLHAREQEFRAFVENAPDQIIRYDKEFRRTYVNPAVTAAYGLPKEAFIGKPVGSVVEDAGLEPDMDAIAAIRRRIKSVFDTGEPTEYEVTFPSPDGRRTYWTRMFPEFDPNGVVINVMTISRETTERKRAEEAIRKSEQVLREAESLGHTGSWEQNLVTGEIFNTEENLRLFFGDDHSKGADFEDYAEAVHPDDREYVIQRRVQLLTDRGPSDIEYRVVWPDGSVHVIFGRATVVYDELGQALRVYGTNVDITERKQAEEEIRRYAARMEALAEIPQALAEVGLDVQAVFETIVRHTAELIGDTCVIRLLSSDEQWLQSVAFHNPNPEVKALMRLFHPTTPISANNSSLTPVLRTGQALLIPITTQDQLRRSVQPEYLPFFEQVGLHSMLIVPLRVKDRVIGTLGLSRDQPGHPYTPDDQVLLQELADRASLTIQNAQLFEQVQGAREQLGSLSRRLLEVQESERRALTTELHDRVGQNLTGLSINLQNMKALLPDETAKTVATKFDDAQALVEHTTRQIRDIMAELHPPELEDYGLAVALETYAERAALRGNLKLIADLPDLAHPPLPPDVSIALFRAAQEAISNVLKHANATQLEVSLKERAGRIRLRVEDNGQGFKPDSASQKEEQTWGLKIMRERIESIGGNVHIESEPGEGTRVTFETERPS